MASSLVSGYAAPSAAVHSETFQAIRGLRRLPHHLQLTRSLPKACGPPWISRPGLRPTGWLRQGPPHRGNFRGQPQANMSKTADADTDAASAASPGSKSSLSSVANSNSRSGANSSPSSGSNGSARSADSSKQKKQPRDRWKKEPAAEVLSMKGERQKGTPADLEFQNKGSNGAAASNAMAGNPGTPGTAGTATLAREGDPAASKRGSKRKVSRKSSNDSSPGGEGSEQQNAMLRDGVEDPNAHAASAACACAAETAGRPAGEAAAANGAAVSRAEDGEGIGGSLAAEPTDNVGIASAGGAEGSAHVGGGHDSILLSDGSWSDEDEEQLSEMEDSDACSEGTGAVAAHSGVEEEALDLLEWGEVCQQVSRFCDTPMAYQLALEEKLHLGRSIEESEALLAETAAALDLPKRLDFDGAADITPVVRRAAGDVSRALRKDGDERGACSLVDLCTVLSFLESADSLHKQLGAVAGNGTSSASLAALGDVLAGASWEQCTSIRNEIARCLNPALRALKDEASDELAEIRKQKRANMAALLSLLQAETRRLVSESQGWGGGWDAQQGAPTRRRSRLCIPIRANMKSLLPGCVSLDTSNTGATLFVEPAGAIPLNNREAELQGRERAEERRVLMEMAALLAASSTQLLDLQARVIQLDLACARARHALWLSGARPTLCDASSARWQGEGQEGQADGGLIGGQEVDHAEYFVDLSGVQHPILLGRALDASSNAVSPASSASLAQRQSAIDSPGAPLDGGNGASAEGPRLPVPIDIRVREGTRAVVVSGPNAGGKTLMLKTLGLAALMAKAGLFLPSARAAPACSPMLPWFDKVLVDIGDEQAIRSICQRFGFSLLASAATLQSLEQSLSTFSGHIRRICRILDAVTPGSLVLLDEVGSGTDPSEGAALASSLLASLADPASEWAACLAMTTTHYAQLKTLKTKLRGFEDASVEFDPVTLQPTFQVLWGEAGESNALSIAATKGMPDSVIARARELVGGMGPAPTLERGIGELGSTSDAGVGPDGRGEEWSSGPLLESLQLQMDHQEQKAQEAAKARVRALTAHAEAKEGYGAVYLQESTLRRKDDERTKIEANNAKTRIRIALDEFEAALGGLKNGGRKVSIQEIEELERATHSIIARHAHPYVVVLKTEQSQELAQSASKDSDVAAKWVPQVGDEVMVKSIGGSTGIIESIKGASCQVKMGRLTMSVRLKDLLQKPK